MRIKDIINYGIKKLNENHIDDSIIKAKLVLQYILNQDNSYLVCYCDKELEDKTINKYMNYIEELIQGKPLQYITHHQEFMKLDLYVDENVLIPQPDTEILVETVINEIQNISKNRKIETIKILDLCTGSGAIAVSIKKYADIQMYASDISEKALEIAKKNAKENEVDIEFIKSDMFCNIVSSNEMQNKFDIIVSNPPYIEREEIQRLPIEVKNEPYIALDGRCRWIRFL